MHYVNQISPFHKCNTYSRKIIIQSNPITFPELMIRKVVLKNESNLKIVIKKCANIILYWLSTLSPWVIA